MSQDVDFYFDVGSPASYLAFTQLPAICEQVGARLNYIPMLLGGVFKATGNHSPATLPAKARYIFTDLSRYAHRYQVPFMMNSHFPINTLMLMRGIVAVQMKAPGKFESWLEAVFSGIWQQGLDVDKVVVVSELCQSVGLDPDELLNWGLDRAVKDKLIENTDEAVRRGVFGAPSMFVGGDLYFGQDRLFMIKERLGG